ncbi:pectin acetylesterase 8-like isoform X2 [Wolffia australiana]
MERWNKRQTGVIVVVIFVGVIIFGGTGNGLVVDLTVLEAATATGAVCLDGSPPAYHAAPGFGAGTNSWLVHIEGGGWCHNISNCEARRAGRLGSSRAMGSIPFSGILSDRIELNPEFYNWNKVKIAYCDGSSLTGDVESVDPRRPDLRRGDGGPAPERDEARRKRTVSPSPFPPWPKSPRLREILHCGSDRRFSLAVLPAGWRRYSTATGSESCSPPPRGSSASPTAASSSTRDIAGSEYIKNYFSEIVTTHGSAKSLPSSCTSKMSPALNVVTKISTPLFVLNAAYDSWQIRNALVSPGTDAAGVWRDCVSDPSLCDDGQLEVLQEFRAAFLGALRGLGVSPAVGLFVNSCFAHCQTELSELWHFQDSPLLENKTIASAVADWFYDRRAVKAVDCPFPCDSTCRSTPHVTEAFDFGVDSGGESLSAGGPGDRRPHNNG